MKNITLSVEDEVLAKARRIAAERNSSVNALVREYLKTLANHESRTERARRELLELARKSRAEVGPKTWTRDDLHER